MRVRGWEPRGGTRPAGDSSCVCKCVLRVRTHVAQAHVASPTALTRQRPNWDQQHLPRQQQRLLCLGGARRALENPKNRDGG